MRTPDEPREGCGVKRLRRLLPAVLAAILAIATPAMQATPAYALTPQEGFYVNDYAGVLLIVAVDDGEVRIEVGDGLSGQIPDSKAGAILDDCFMFAASESNLETAIYDTYL